MLWTYHISCHAWWNCYEEGKAGGSKIDNSSADAINWALTMSWARIIVQLVLFSFSKNSMKYMFLLSVFLNKKTEPGTVMDLPVIAQPQGGRNRYEPKPMFLIITSTMDFLMTRRKFEIHYWNWILKNWHRWKINLMIDF